MMLTHVSRLTWLVELTRDTGTYCHLHNNDLIVSRYAVGQRRIQTLCRGLGPRRIAAPTPKSYSSLPGVSFPV